MDNFPLSELDQLIANENLESWRPPAQRKRIVFARRAAYLLRKKRKLKIPSSKRKRKKRSVLGYNAHVKRNARRLIVAAKRDIQNTNYENAPLGTLIAGKQPSIFLDGLYPQRETKWLPVASRLRTRVHEEIDVNNFCFLSNPVETLNNLERIARVEATCLSSRINFLDKQCKDIGPWLVFAVMRNHMARVFNGGAISSSMSKVISALGLQKALQFSLEPNLDGHADVWAFPLRARRPAGTSTSETQHLDPQAAEKVGGDLCGAISQWLSECVGQELTRQGQRRVKKIVGESLDNAERHSRREHTNDGDWMLTGFMAKRKGPNGPLFKCQLSFLSIGSSISETIQDAPEETLQLMDEYIADHAPSLPNHHFAADHLRTIFALQDTVTRDRNAFEQGRGGTGFRDIVCLFGDLAGNETGENDARLAIVSGRTCLHIGFTHSEAATPLPNQRFNIWLNETNDRGLPPDHNAVLELEKAFCGTLITMGFTLDPDYLEKSIDG